MSTPPKRYEIAPGYGVKGIVPARELLVERMRTAAIEAVGHADKIRVAHDGQGSNCYPFLVAQFDESSKLIVRLWQHDALWGIGPWVFWEVTRHGDLWTPLSPRPNRWDSEAEMVYAACQKVLATVELIEIP